MTDIMTIPIAITTGKFFKVKTDNVNGASSAKYTFLVNKLTQIVQYGNMFGKGVKKEFCELLRIPGVPENFQGFQYCTWYSFPFAFAFNSAKQDYIICKYFICK